MSKLGNWKKRKSKNRNVQSSQLVSFTLARVTLLKVFGVQASANLQSILVPTQVLAVQALEAILDSVVQASVVIPKYNPVWC